MRKIFASLFLSLSFLPLNLTQVNSQELKKYDDLSVLANGETRDFLTLSTNSIDNKNVEILLTGIGDNPQLNKDITSSLITLNIYSSDLKNIDSFQSLSLPSVGIKTLTLSGYQDTIKIVITPFEEVNFSEPEITIKNNALKMLFPKQDITGNELKENNIFSVKPIQPKINRFNRSERATAPSLGDIAVGTTFIPNLKTVELEGPEVSMTFKGTTAKDAIEFLISKTNYGYVWVQDDPTFKTDQRLSNLPNETSILQSDQSDAVSDSPRFITMTIKDKPFSVAFNSILMSSGLEAKLENGIVYVGPDVQERIFSSRISRIYRLNQTTANAAASYLANLGAKVTQTNTITTAVTSGASQSESVSGAETSATTTEESTTSVRSYGSNEGPLLGLIATTDDRLQTITLVGTPELVKVAENYIKQLDLRQRQVALTVKILDVEISDGTNLDNSWAFRQGNKFIVNASGQLLSTINDTQPPNALGFPSAPSANNSNEYGDEVFFGLLKSDILSKDTKIIANPTLI